MGVGQSGFGWSQVNSCPPRHATAKQHKQLKSVQCRDRFVVVASGGGGGVATGDMLRNAGL